jgi:hypothetical protein
MRRTDRQALASIAAVLALAVACGNASGEFSGDGIVRGRVLICTWHLAKRTCQPPQRARQDGHTVSATATQLNGPNHATADVDLQHGTFRWQLAPGRYRATLNPHRLRGLSATTTTFTVRKGAVTRLTLLYQSPPPTP